VSALGTSAVLEAALEYARAGLHVFPLSWGRRPIALCPACQPDRGCPGKDRCLCGVDTCHGFWAATTDEAKIRRWYTQHPDWQVAIRTGAASNLVVLDVDLDKGGLDTLVGLERAGLDKAGTGCQLSGSGLSFHLLYRHPGGVVPSTQGSWPSGLGPGLDVRGDGGYIVAAPSRHPATGARYEMLGELGDPPFWCPPAVIHRSATATPALTQDRPPFSQETGPGTCPKVSEVFRQVSELVKANPHHNEVRKSVMQLRRLRTYGHRGVPGVLVQLGDVYVTARAQRDNPRSARVEYDRLVAQAPVPEPTADAACGCDIAWAQKLNRTRQGLSKGVAGNTEVKVMRHLLLRVEQQHTWSLKKESQRTIAESIDVHQPTICKALKRLGAAKVLEVRPRFGRDRAYRVVPPWASETLSIEKGEAAGTSIDNFSRASVHPLFGAGGLGAGLQDTFAALPELNVQLTRGRLVRLRAGSRVHADQARLLDSYVGARQIPRAVLGKTGVTASHVARVTGRHPSTVRAHLKRLEQHGLAVKDGCVWWRVRFDPETVQQELGIVDTVALKAVNHHLQRRLWWESRCDDDLTTDGQPRFEKVHQDGQVQFVDCRTGEVRWRDPVPETERQVAGGS